MIKFLAFFTALIFYQGFLAKAIVHYFEVKFTSMPLENVWFLLAYLRPFCCQTIFIVFLKSLLMRVENLNTLFQNPEAIQNLKFVGKLLGKFLDTISSLNYFFSFNFMTFLFDLLIMAIFTIFFSYDILVHKLSTKDIILFLGAISYVSISSAICLNILILSSKLEENKKIVEKQIIHLKLKAKKFHKFLDLSINQFGISRMELSCGLFVFNKSHMFIICSSIFSYFIVMIQFDIMIPKQLNQF